MYRRQRLVHRANETRRHARHVAPGRTAAMTPPTIRPARSDEYDEIARVWMNSWASTGLEETSNFLLAKLRARIPLEIEKGWSLFVADDGGALAAMLALHLPNSISISCSLCESAVSAEGLCNPAPL